MMNNQMFMYTWSSDY